MQWYIFKLSIDIHDENVITSLSKYHELGSLASMKWSQPLATHLMTTTHSMSLQAPMYPMIEGRLRLYVYMAKMGRKMLDGDLQLSRLIK